MYIFFNEELGQSVVQSIDFIHLSKCFIMYSVPEILVIPMSLNHGLHSPKPHVHAPSFSTSTIPSGFSFGVNQSTSRTKRSREEDDEDDIILQHPSSSRGYEHDTSHLELDEEEEIREQEDDMETSGVSCHLHPCDH